MKIFNLHENFQKTLQIVLITSHYIGDDVGEKVNGQKNINYQCIKKWIVLVLTGIYQRLYYIGIPIYNEHDEKYIRRRGTVLIVTGIY
jgi:hypothetical protein